MYVRFWGTRGSIASPGHATAKYGGNTSCVEVRAPDGTLIVLDCGTGARELGLHLARTAPRPLRLHMFIGHTHWDHIQGFPFFTPAFLPGAEMNIYAPLGFQRSLEEALSGQMESSYFPVKLRELRSRIHFTELDEGFFRVGEVLVETQYLNHTAPTIAYRMTSGKATVAYVTDHEPFWKPVDGRFDHPGDQRHVAFLRGAHLVIHDAQYSHEEYQQRIGWGHSSSEYATDVALAAGVHRLALFHHDPTHDDAAMAELEAQARARVKARGATLEVFAAAEGLALDVKGNGSVTTVSESSALRRRPLVGRRVIVIDGDAEEVASIEHELAEDSLTLIAVPDAGQALDRVADTAPDIVILRGQGLGGGTASLIARLRSTIGRDDFPILLLTDDQERSGDLELGTGAPTDYLARPFSPPMLRARIRSWLSRSLVPRAPEAETTDPIAGARPDQDAVAQYVDLLRGTPLFRPLKRDQLETLAAHAIDQTFPEGHVVVREGSPAQNLFVILSGRVRVTETSRETQAELLLSELGPGQIFGELGILREQPRVANVIAVERTRCLVLPPENFLQAVQTSPELALGLLQVLAARLTDADRRVARYAPDPLTGLMSRRAFLDHYRRLAASARRRGTGALCVLLDVVHLKDINDRFGYAMGDEVLRAVSEALLEATRTTDVVCRSGGDEFAVLLVDVGPQDVDDVVRRLEQRLGEAGARRQLPVDLPYSIGIAFAAKPPDEPDELLSHADADMSRRRRG